MSSLRYGLLRGRRAAALVFGLFVVAGLVLVFAGTLTRSTDIEAEAARLRAEIAALEADYSAGGRALAIYRTDAFATWHARSLGLGGKGEKRIMLPDDAPSPPPIVPLGADAGERQAMAPIDAWLDLLFGA